MNFYQDKISFFVFTLLMMLLTSFQVQAELHIIELPHTFSAGTPARASEVNANFEVAYEYIQKLLNVLCKDHPTESWCQTLTNDYGMTFVLIQPGSFVMGSPENELGRSSREVQHGVTLSQAFYLQTTEVTQGQWKTVMGDNPSHFSGCDDCPVEQVSWEDAQEFIEKLNLHENANRYRLPTEAQWEYAARSGSITALANGNLVETECNLDSNLNAMGWYCGNSDNKTHPVAQKEANSWGLYDMHGNVWEWCQDWSDSYPTNTVVDPMGPSSGTYKVVRGGGWHHGARTCRSANSYAYSPNYRYYLVGLRLSMIVNP